MNVSTTFAICDACFILSYPTTHVSNDYPYPRTLCNIFHPRTLLLLKLFTYFLKLLILLGNLRFREEHKKKKKRCCPFEQSHLSQNIESREVKRWTGVWEMIQKYWSLRSTLILSMDSSISLHSCC